MAGADAGHCGATELALVAVGEPAPSPVFERHMNSCPSCSDLLGGMVGVIDLGRAAQSDRAYAQPPAGVWQAVQEAVAAGPPPEAARGGATRGGSVRGWTIAALVALLVALAAVLAVVLLG